MTLIKCEDVSFAYEGNIVADKLDFCIESGDYICVLGENGSGKSTLLRGLLGLKAPYKGKITLCGGLSRNEIGYLPQQTASQNDFPASVFEVVLSGRLGARGIRPFYSRADKTAAIENMALLGITDLKKHCLRELSGGQIQRVMLARALCSTKKILLLDEPSTGLDPLVIRDLYRIIGEIIAKTGVSVVMVSHDAGAAVKHANKVLHLKKSQVFFGNATEYVRTEVGRTFLNPWDCEGEEP